VSLPCSGVGNSGLGLLRLFLGPRSKKRPTGGGLTRGLGKCSTQSFYTASQEMNGLLRLRKFIGLNRHMKNEVRFCTGQGGGHRRGSVRGRSGHRFTFPKKRHGDKTQRRRLTETRGAGGASPSPVVILSVRNGENAERSRRAGWGKTGIQIVWPEPSKKKMQRRSKKDKPPEKIGR